MLLPTEAPVMTLSSSTLFPQGMLPLFIFEPRYRMMLAESLATHRTFVVALRKPGQTRETPCTVAGLGLIRACVQYKDGTSHLVLQGLARVALGKVSRYKPFRVQRIEPIPTFISEKTRITSLASKVVDIVAKPNQYGWEIPLHLVMAPEPKGKSNSTPVSFDHILQHLRRIQDPCQLADIISGALLDDVLERQVILETADLEQRLTLLIKFLLAKVKARSKQKS